MRGEHSAAVEHYHQAIDASRTAADEDGVAVNLHNLARSELALGRLEQGLEALRQSIAIARRLGYREVIAYCLSGLSELAMLEEDAVRAAMLLGASEQLFSEIGAILSPDEMLVQERVTEYTIRELGERRADELRAEGADSSLDEVLDDVASRA
jgi:tetratricopeptide (TPR) repeat protein